MDKLLFDKLGVLISTCGTVYKVDVLKEFVDYMAELGYNTFYLEITAGYEIEEEPMFAYLRGKYSKAELKEFDQYAASKGITVIPTIQTLAHMEVLYRWPQFLSYRDIDDIMLVGEPKVYDLIEKIIKTMAECFSAKIVHLGLDEAWKLGRGRYKDLHGDRDWLYIMKEHLDKVLEICQKYDVKPEMWGDMYIHMAYGAYDRGEMTFDRSEEVKKTINPNVKIHYWDYYSLTKDRYIKFIDKFKKITDSIVFDGCAWNYIGFEPHNAYSIKATEAAFEACLEKDVKEVVITTWGGDGTPETSIWACMPTFVAAAEFARGNYDMDKIKEKFKKLMNIEFDAFIDMEHINRVQPRDPNNKERFLLTPSKYLMYNDALAGMYDTTVIESEKHIFVEAAEKMQKYVGHEKWGYIFKTIKAHADLMEHKFDLGVKTRRAYLNGDKKELERLADEIYPLVIERVEKMYRAFREQHYIELKPNGFEIHDMRFGGLKKRLSNCREIILDYCSGKLDRIEELEQKLYDYLDGTEEHKKGAFNESGHRYEFSVLGR